MNDNDDEALNKYIADQQNLHDHLTRKMYGSDTKFEQLSAFGQHTIEAIAREFRRAKLSDQKEPDDKFLRSEVQRLSSEVDKLKRENYDLWEENEMYRLRELEAEDD
jgi:ABC-type phosphate transport system auxiliary subunit